VTGYMVVFGPCWMCKAVFGFHPDLVTSVPIDPVTGLAPDLGGDPERAQREPLCPPCCRLANPERARRGLEPLDERDSLDPARLT
jgi:hypothetical protein